MEIIHQPLDKNHKSGSYATDESEEFRKAEMIEHNDCVNPERLDDEEYDNCEYSEYEFNVQNGEENNLLGDIEQSNNNDEIVYDNNENGLNDDDDDADDKNIVDSRRPFFQVQSMELAFPFTANTNFHQKDHLLSVVAMAVRHNLSYEATLSILKWLKITHDNNTLPTTKKALWKSLKRNESMVIRHMYCQECKDYLGTGKKLTKQCSCKECDPKKKSSKLQYFLPIDLIKQLSEFLSIPNIGNSLNYRFTRKKKDINAVEDIYDGSEYVELCQPGNFLSNPYNYSLTFNTDGCQLA